MYNEKIQRSQADQLRKQLENTTGVKYRKDTTRILYENTGKINPNLLVKKHYSDKEIKDARKRRDHGFDVLNAAMIEAGRTPDKKYLQMTTKVANLMREQDNSPDRLIAQYKTKGEKVAAAALLGPIGLFVASDKNAPNRLSETNDHALSRARRRNIYKQIKINEKNQGG